MPGCECSFREESLSKIADLEERVSVLTKGIVAISNLISDSDGVTGLHRNGDDAPWHSLLGGGFYESWLGDFTIAEAMVLKYEEKQEEA